MIAQLPYDRPFGLAKQHGAPSSRDKRKLGGNKRYVRAVGHSFVLRPACCCDAVEEPGGICPTCGGASLTNKEIFGK